MRILKLQIIISFIFTLSLAALTAIASEFEGEFQVGNTSCMVTPTKMAFEVRWKKGMGYMPFFFDREMEDGRYIFVSEEKKDGKDRFEFDNKYLQTGKFIRSDGKIFTVKKISAANSPR